MWLIFNKMFNWQYIEYRDSATSFTARIHKLPNGQIRMKGGYCRGHYDANLNDNGTFIGRGGVWIPLTF